MIPVASSDGRLDEVPVTVAVLVGQAQQVPSETTIEDQDQDEDEKQEKQGNEKYRKGKRATAARLYA